MKEIYLFPGQWAYSREPAEISTILGSCVGVALYDRERRTGGLNHYLLPTQAAGEAPSTRYGSVAIPTLIEAMVRDGSEHRSLAAKVYGGANVLSALAIGEKVGARNIEFALETLAKYRIPIVEQNLGGQAGRRIKLNSTNFDVTHLLQEKTDRSAVDNTGFGVPQAARSFRVLIVDDSATVRTLFQKVFRRFGVQVVGTASNAYEAREMIVAHKPDVITLDLEMPKMNGVAFLEKLMKYMPVPVVVVSSLSAQGDAAMRALELGAIEFVHKPSQFDPAALLQLGEVLVEKLRAAASVKVGKLVEKPPNKEFASLRRSSPKEGVHSGAELRAIVVGGNAGSAASLSTLVMSLPSDTPPVIVANSTVAPFLGSYVSQLKGAKVGVQIAEDGAAIKMGYVYFAPPGKHCRIKSRGSLLTLEVAPGQPVSGQLPSSTALFTSAAELGGSALALLLGGFGSDGVEGLQKIKASGGATMVENPDDVQFPFAPVSAISLGLADQILGAAEMADATLLHRGRKVAA